MFQSQFRRVVVGDSNLCLCFAFQRVFRRMMVGDYNSRVYVLYFREFWDD